jgi:hypothetical protein
MPKIVVILDDTSASQRLGVAMLRSIGEIVESVQFVTVAELPAVASPKAIYCPMTLAVPPAFQFWGQSIGQTCQQIDLLRDLVATTIGFKVGDGGNLWLPIVWTAGDPIYGEVIGKIDGDNYRQPIHLDEIDCRSIYQLGTRLLTQLNAPPATYLVQFNKTDPEIVFDRLFPFPAIPALTSVGIQHPDLFECHWRCITHQSIDKISAK